MFHGVKPPSEFGWIWAVRIGFLLVKSSGRLPEVVARNGWFQRDQGSKIGHKHKHVGFKPDVSICFQDSTLTFLMRWINISYPISKQKAASSTKIRITCFFFPLGGGAFKRSHVFTDLILEFLQPSRWVGAAVSGAFQAFAAFLFGAAQNHITLVFLGWDGEMMSFLEGGNRGFCDWVPKDRLQKHINFASVYWIVVMLSYCLYSVENWTMNDSQHTQDVSTRAIL